MANLPDGLELLRLLDKIHSADAAETVLNNFVPVYDRATNRILSKKQKVFKDIRYPHLSGDARTDYIRPFLLSPETAWERGYGIIIILSCACVSMWLTQRNRLGKFMNGMNIR